MARTSNLIPQPYPRVNDTSRADHGCLDESALVPHKRKIVHKELQKLIREAIAYAETKSSREALTIPADADAAELQKFYVKEGAKLFTYFKKYVGDPAASAHQAHRKNFRTVGLEIFRNRALQKGRMNSGWRYQALAVSLARAAGRFKSVSDIGASEGDFNATIAFSAKAKAQFAKDLSLYVSVKNRSNTMGGQDWPKAIEALERVANNDKNRGGPYCCVFGIAMDRGTRLIKRAKLNNAAYSQNTEVWLSDFFWPFFANFTYEEIMLAVLDVLTTKPEAGDELPTQIDVPDELLDAFGKCCIKAGLVDELGNFNDPKKLVRFFCETPKKRETKKKAKS